MGAVVHVFLNPAIANVQVPVGQEEAEAHVPRIYSTQVLYIMCLKIPAPVVFLT